MLLPIVDEVGNIILHQSIAEDSWGHGNYVCVLVFVCVCVCWQICLHVLMAVGHNSYDIYDKMLNCGAV